MTRAALVPMGPDPFLVAYWFRNYRAMWAGEADEVHALIADQTDAAAWDYIALQAYPDVTLHRWPERIDHGRAIGRLMDATTADHVVLLEDDAYVRHRGQVAECFAALERGEADVVGCPRDSASDLLLRTAGRRWGKALPHPVTAEEGHALWPCFLFAARRTLLATDRDYSARRWEPGEWIRGLRIRPAETVSADTFVATSYQLRARRYRIREEAQYRVTNADHLTQWSAGAPWFHVGSLSTGYGHLLGKIERPAIHDTGGREDWARRVSWWERFLRHADGLPEHAAHYRRELDALMAWAGIGRGEVDNWTGLYQPWITWGEGA